MNGEEYKVVSKVMEEHGYEVEPEPADGEDRQFFDIVSAEGEIPLARLLETIYTAIPMTELRVAPEVIAAQSHRVTFEDLSAS